jgi:hypothetical protein
MATLFPSDLIQLRSATPIPLLATCSAGLDNGMEKLEMTPIRSLGSPKRGTAAAGEARVREGVATERRRRERRDMSAVMVV